jgi:hypothetical protein
LTRWSPTRGQGTERLTEASPPTGQGHGGTR